MRTVLLLLALVAAPLTFSQERDLSLGEHMRAMGYILDEIVVFADDAETYHEAARRVRALRDHLVESIALTPESVKRLSPGERNAAMIEYHQLMARVIYMTAALENALDAEGDYISESFSRELDIEHLLHEINVLVGQAHAKFR